MSVAFAPSLGALVGFLARRTLKDLWGDPAELTRVTLDAANRTGATHVLFPFDSFVLAEACGLPLEWSAGAPTLGSTTQTISVADLEPHEVMMVGRVPAVLQAAKYIGSSAGLAGDVPSPSLLVMQLGGDLENLDDLGVAEDICVAFARGFLEASASLLIVRTNESDIVDSGGSSLARLADHFGVRLATAAFDPGVAVLPIARLSAAELVTGGSLVGDKIEVVLTDEPVVPGSDLTRIQSFAAALLGR